VLTLGTQVDVVSLQRAHPALYGAASSDVIDRWIFASNRPAVDRVWVSGRLRVEHGEHLRRAAIEADYARALSVLLAD
jgi:formimidoylglutamate deiminase